MIYNSIRTWSCVFWKRSLPEIIKTHQSRSLATRASSSSISDLIRPITVQTCVGLYPRLQQKHPHIFPRKVPTEGVSLSVKYADTAVCRLKSPDHVFEKTIVAVPGCPGNLAHFDWLLAHYRPSTSVRAIALNLPDFRHTRSSGGIFWHTAEEKVAFLADFLKTIGVERVDCLVAHSMGFQAVTGLVETKHPHDITVKSMALFAPQPIWDMTPPMRSFVERLFYLRTDLWYGLLELLRVHQLKGTVLRFEDIDEFLWLMTTVRDKLTPVDAHRRIYHLRRQSSIPVVVQFGSREFVVSQRAARQLFEEFGLLERLTEYDAGDERRDPAEIAGPVDGPRIRGYLAHGGGHFSFAKQPKVSLRMIENLLRYYD